MTEAPVLLVDDNEDDVLLLRRALERIGFGRRVVSARDGQEALDYLRAEGGSAKRNRRITPVLTVLDLKMPRVGGLEVLRQLRADPWLKYLLVIVLTSSDEEKDQTEAMRLGVNLYARKPMTFDGYLKLARRIDSLASAVPA